MGISLGLASPGIAFAELTTQRIYTSATTENYVDVLSRLVQAPSGNFYGTVLPSSLNLPGYLFRLTSSGAFEQVASFGFNGTRPQGGLLLATDGNLYGTTTAGGIGKLGTIFRYTPEGALQLIHNFNGLDGASPQYELIQTRDGFLYGVTAGNSTNSPTVFKASTNGTVTTLTNFSLAVGGSPCDGLVEGPDGWLYGAAASPFIGPSPSVIGSIFKISTNGTRQILTTFMGSLTTGGLQALAGLTLGPDGYLYGTLADNIAFNPTSKGTVFRMTTNGVRTTIATFNGTNGSFPMTRLVLARDGAFYGFARNLFRVTTNGTITVLSPAGFGDYSFSSGPPPLAQASDGNLYGVGLNYYNFSGNSFAFRLVEPPVLALARTPTNSAVLGWNSFTGGVYQAVYKTTLEETNWHLLGSTITATRTNLSLTDPINGNQQRWYRVSLLP